MEFESGYASEIQTRLRQKMRLQPRPAALGLLAIDLATQKFPTSHPSEPLALATAILSVAGMAWIYRQWKNRDTAVSD